MPTVSGLSALIPHLSGQFDREILKVSPNPSVYLMCVTLTHKPNVAVLQISWMSQQMVVDMPTNKSCCLLLQSVYGYSMLS